MTILEKNIRNAEKCLECLVEEERVARERTDAMQHHLNLLLEDLREADRIEAETGIVTGLLPVA